MRLFTDAFTGAQVLSDSYKLVEDYEGAVVKVQSRLVVKGNEQVDIGCGNAFGGAGEEEQAGGPPVQKVIDLVDAFQYQQTSFDQAGFEKYFKTYMKKVLGHLKQKKPERVDPFMKGARAFFDWVKANFGDLSFYTPSDYDADHIIIMSYYEGENPAPTFIYVMDGLKQTKV